MVQKLKEILNFPLNTNKYKKKKNSISTEFILKNHTLIPLYEEKYIIFNKESRRFKCSNV